MNPVVRGLAVYLFLFLVFRIAGKRSLAETSTFDLVLLLIISEATQQGMLGNDFSITNAFILIATLVCTDVTLNFIKDKWPLFDKVADGLPLVLLQDGVCIKEHLRKTQVDEHDILEAARIKQGLMNLSQIRYAVLERGGEISIIPA